ncbi:LysE family translocator [Streptomyces zagrosensis]|uniref:Threonine/homoserine/homoserine lactone efflux protein n=1 Tax=Streptomyces zagrosensis TaxID=1042984 RepID=A0A7W9QG10_9ACTN|nr:LysE family translocator [Streptomyces zagrosensis]MBB5938547.1 threonine/homoserine/homoserine lactone efflux protein [Streptomyces zagrosensis]
MSDREGGISIGCASISDAPRSNSNHYCGSPMVNGVYIATIFAMVAAPGPTFVVLVNETLRFGRGAGLVTILGSSTGLLMWAATSALGLAALTQTSELVFTTFKLAGAAYLCYLAVMTVRNRRNFGHQPADVPTGHSTATLWRSYRSGLVTSAANPKMATVYLALIPQFLPTDGGSPADVVTLTAVQIMISAGWYVVVVILVGLARQLLAKPAVRTGLAWVSGAVLLLLGLRTAVMSGPTA